jgi:hypothetical protein
LRGEPVVFAGWRLLLGGKAEVELADHAQVVVKALLALLYSIKVYLFNQKLLQCTSFKSKQAFKS